MAKLTLSLSPTLFAFLLLVSIHTSHSTAEKILPYQWEAPNARPVALRNTKRVTDSGIKDLWSLHDGADSTRHEKSLAGPSDVSQSMAQLDVQAAVSGIGVESQHDHHNAHRSGSEEFTLLAITHNEAAATGNSSILAGPFNVMDRWGDLQTDSSIHRTAEQENLLEKVAQTDSKSAGSESLGPLAATNNTILLGSLGQPIKWGSASGLQLGNTSDIVQASLLSKHQEFVGPLVTKEDFHSKAFQHKQHAADNSNLGEVVKSNFTHDKHSVTNGLASEHENSLFHIRNESVPLSNSDILSQVFIVLKKLRQLPQGGKHILSMGTTKSISFGTNDTLMSSFLQVVSRAKHEPLAGIVMPSHKTGWGSLRENGINLPSVSAIHAAFLFIAVLVLWRLQSTTTEGCRKRRRREARALAKKRLKEQVFHIV